MFIHNSITVNTHPYICVLLFSFSFPRGAVGRPPPSPARLTATVRAVQGVMPSVVNISTERVIRVADPFEQFFNNFFEPHARYFTESIPFGSGIVVDSHGLVMTNYHVIQRASTIQVRFFDESTYTAQIVAFDVENDLCLLQLDGAFSENPLTAVRFALPDDLLLGETVVTVGNPFSLGHSVAKGVLSAKNRSLREGNVTFNDILQTDAAINPGNSGGPLINLDGELIGMNLAIRRDAEGIGFAIPLKRIEEVLARWLVPSRFSMGFLGVTARTTLHDGDPAVALEKIDPTGPGAAAGLSGGDVVTKANGQPVTRAIEFGRLIWRARPGQEFRFELTDGRIIELTVASMSADALIETRLGVRVQELTDPLKRALGLRQDIRGLAISEILPKSEFLRYQLRWGDMVRRGDVIVRVNGVDTGSRADLFDALRETRGGMTVPVILLTIDSIGEQLSIAPVRINVTLN